MNFVTLFLTAISLPQGQFWTAIEKADSQFRPDGHR